MDRERLQRIIENLDVSEERLCPAELEIVALAVAKRPELFEDLIATNGKSSWWLLLHRAANFEVKVLTWDCDVASDWHDHGGSSGAIAVTQGALYERHRAADHVNVIARCYGTGQYTSFGPDYVHDVVLQSDEPAVSIHVYSPPLSGLTFYDETPYGFVAREVVPEERRSTYRISRPRSSV